MDDRTRDDLNRADRNRDRDRDLTDRGIANQAKGSAKEFEGKVRGAAGDAVDDTSEQLKGKAKDLEGKGQRKLGEKEVDADN